MIIKLDNLSKIRNQSPNKIIVFCSGSFDLAHVGHILFLEDCKKHGEIFVVSVGSDKMLRYNKGVDRPILNEHIRLKTIDSLKVVDYSFIDKISTENEPLKLLKFVFESLKPNFYVINEDAFDIPYREKICKDFNIKLIILKRWSPKEFENISTTRLIDKIKKLNMPN